MLLIRDSKGALRKKMADNLLLGWLIRQNDDLVFKAKTKTINLLMPSFDDLRQFMKGEADSQDFVNEYIPYYQKSAEYFPHLSAMRAMLGFCYYYDGKIPQALAEFKAAHELTPDFFFFTYNLGIINLKIENYEKAAAYFEKSLKQNMKVSLMRALNSRVYQQIIGGPDFHYDLKKSVEDAYAKALFLYGYSQKELGREQEGKDIMRRALSMDKDLQEGLMRLKIL